MQGVFLGSSGCLGATCGELSKNTLDSLFWGWLLQMMRTIEQTTFEMVLQSIKRFDERWLGSFVQPLLMPRPGQHTLPRTAFSHQVFDVGRGAIEMEVKKAVKLWEKL